MVLAGCGGGGGGGTPTTPTPSASASLPAITALTPASGPVAGGITVQIDGSALGGATVTVGGRAAASVNVNADGTHVTAVVPAGAQEGAVDVVVTTPAGTATSPVKFLYNGTPTVSFISPATGPLNGGTNLTILGSAFDGTVTVEIGGVAATSVAISADKTQITCVTPPGVAVGANDVQITASAAGHVTVPGGFTYTAAVGGDPPAISSVSPARGPMNGGTTLVILGARFTGNIVVTVGGRAASNVAVNAALTQITCATPASPTAGAADVVVLSDRAGSATAAGAFNYNPAPTVTAITPNTGPQGGGAAFAIDGSNFDGLVTVTIGDRGATALAVNATHTRITGSTPGSTSTGPKDVVVRSDANGSATLAGGYTYNGPPPTLSRIAPTTGPNRGGTLVTIDGQNFRGNVTVTFGALPATAVTVNGARTQLTCRTPPFPATGAVDVVVTSDSNGSVTAASAFVYNSNPAPVITTIAPNSGPLAGGTPVTITGANFLGALTLTFGGIAATGISVTPDATQITATVPRGAAAGAVDVFLDSTTQGNVTSVGGYTYNPPPDVTGIFPTSGPEAGNTQIIISGVNFFNAVSVQIGTVAASVIAVDPSGTQITARTNASPTTGTKNVTVTSSTNGTVVKTNAFTYTPNPPPTITAISPDNGPLAGGTVVTLTGTNFEGTVNVTVGGVGVGAVNVDGTKTQLTFSTPPAATPGARDVVVGSNTHGTVTLGGGFTYNPPPTITAVAPASGPATGGTPVTISGTGFGGVVSVRFGFLTATAVVASTNTITCLTPAGTAGQQVNVTVDSSTNGVVTKAGAFLYNPPPTLNTVTPNNGPLTGGNTVVIAGANLGGTVNVTFGNVGATTLATGANGSSVTVLAPAGVAAGAVTISVFSSTNGPATLAGAYTYNPLPTLTLPLVPSSGPLAGGTDVTINGTNFGGTVNVTVGGLTAVVQSVNAAKTQVVARTPAGAAAVAVDVVVASSTNGIVTAPGAFTYNPPPVIFAVNPASGPQAGGTLVTIDGNNFFGTVNVTIGAVAAAVASVNAFHTQVTVITQASPDFGAKDVTLSSSTHGTVTKAGAFTYVPPLPTITSIQPAAGQLDGGTVVTITGTSFEDTVNVTFGGAPATQVTVLSKTSLTCVTPPGVAPVAVDVTLSSSSHGSVTQVGGFTYNPRMTITSLTPNQGPVGGFNTIAIDGTNFFGNVSVTIGGNALIGTSVNAAKTRITGTVPAATGTGAVPLVVVSDTHGTVQSTYTYNNTPAINALNPPNGPLVGGTTVDITGAGFFGTIIVKIGATFNSAPAASVQSVSADGTTIRILTPPGASAGPTNVFVSSSTNGQIVRANGFTYNSPPQATGVVPNNGPLVGGTPVVINGGGFFGTVTVTFGGVAATVLAVDTLGNTISAVSPAGTVATAVDVVVNASAGGASTLTGGFTFNPLPTVTAGVTPTEGPQQGGTPIAIAGTGFGGTVNVTVCGVPATNVVVNLTRTLINCRTAATVTPGLGDVEVSSSTNGRVISPNAFTYNASPTLSSILPNNGPQAGFTPITVNGTGFRGTVTATIGGTAVTALTVVSPTQFTAQTPPSLTEGPRDVVITSTLNGTLNVTNGYTYNPSTVISGLAPPNGPLAGGNAVVISGANFGGTVNVTFGASPATVTFQTLNQLNVVAPPGLASGPVNVTVESSTSGIAASPGAYTYNAPMTITSLSPNNGPLIGGTLVSMTGTNFVDVTGVTVDGKPTSGVTVSSATNVTFVTPAGVFPGPVNVIVTSTTRGTVTGTGLFTYNPEPFILNVTPSEGPLFGGTNVTITGSNFATPLSVKFGAQTANTISVTSDTIVVRSPPSAVAGDVVVSVNSVPNGPFSIFPGFTYNNTPTGAIINPNNGPQAGGNNVIITGTGFDPTTTVFFGPNSVTITAISPDRTTINGVVPRAASPGAVDVQINSPAAGTLNVTNGYFYNPPISVASIVPTSGPVTGGQLVTITGQNLFGPPGVKIGTLDVLSPTVGPSGTVLQFTTPTSPVTGTFNVVLTSSAFGTNISTNAYTYNSVLTLQALTPTTGSVLGGTTVSVTGTGFFNLTAVELGGVPVRSFTTNVSGTLITAVTERSSPGFKDLRVASSSHGQATLVGAYTYVPDYAAGAQQPTFSNPLGLVVKDMNGDGKPDVIVGCQLDNTVIFYFNNSVPGGTPSFAATSNVTFSTGSEPTGIAVADFDHDGLPDVITANKLSNDLTVLLSLTAPGASSPTFTALPPISNTGGPSAIVAADFDGDGRIDVAVTEELVGVVNIRLNTTVTPGAPTFNGTQIVGAGLAPTAIVAADLNGDGKIDLATANRDSDSVSILRNNCTPGSIFPSFTNVATLTLPPGSSPQGISAADLNGDGRMDLIVANAVTRNVMVFINTTTDSTGTPTFAAPTTFQASGAPAGIAVGDIDLNGRQDIATANDSGNSISFYLNNTAPGAIAGALSGRTDFPTGTGPRSIALADLNGDGRPELITVSRLSDRLQVFQHNSQLGIAPALYTGRVDFGAGVSPNALVAADINRDGKLDLLVANQGSNDFSVKVNNTAPGADVFDFLTVANFPTGIPPSGPSGIAAVDLDGDGRLDAVVANASNQNIRAHLNTTTPGTGAISFGAGFGFGFPLANPAGIGIGDLSLDGRPDVVVAQRGVSRVMVLRNTTTLGGGPPAFVTLNVTSGAGPRAVAIGDLNGDGKNDLVSANGSSSTITVTLNQTPPGGALTLPTGVDFATDLNPAGVVLLDFNGDGKLDIATCNQGGSTVTFYRNTTPPGSLVPQFNGRIEFPTGVGPAGIQVMDVNGDGRPDIITSALNGNQVSVLLNGTPPGGGQAFFTTITNVPVGNGPEGVAVGDFNGDGRPDVAAAAKAAGVISVIRNITTP